MSRRRGQGGGEESVTSIHDGFVKQSVGISRVSNINKINRV